MTKRSRTSEARTAAQAGFTIFVLALAIMMTGAGCTKKKQLKNEVSSEAFVGKSEVDGKLFSMVRGVEEADSNNNIGAIPGQLMDFGLVRARITETELQLLSAHDPLNRDETASIVASFPIKSHFDIEREQNDFGEKTHRIIEKQERPWQQRQYMRVDWGNPTKRTAKVTNQLWAYGDFNEENVVLLEDLKDDNGHLSFVSESTISAADAGWIGDSEGNGDDREMKGFRVTFRTHLMPVKDTGFVPVEMGNEDFAKFGFFRTYENFEDPKKGLLDRNIKRYANVFDVCEAGRLGADGKPAACATNKITWVVSKGFPQKYMDTTRSVVRQWNETFQKALGRTDDVVVLDETKQAGLSDPRYNVIGHYGPKSNGGLLGLAQFVNDPRTGQTLSARAIVYEDGIRGSLGYVDDMLDLIAQDPALAQELVQTIATEGQLPTAQEVSASLQQMQDVLQLKEMKSAAAMASESIEGQVAFAHEKSKGTAARSLLHKQSLMAQKPQLFRVQEQDRIGSLGLSLPFMNLRADESLHKTHAGLEQMLLAPGFLQKMKQQNLRQAALGVHGSEIVEEATARFILKLLKKHNDVASLESKRARIEAEVDQLMFYTTLLHEMGHTFGLRHNFAGSADRRHYHQEYFNLAQKVGKDPEVTAADLDPYSNSSIMDYGADFYSQAGGLGPYDQAAIKFAYDRALNRKADPIVLAGYEFCTDHQVDESIRCRRFDKGANVTEITKSLIDRYKRSYLRTHFRRGRAMFDQTSGGIPPYVLYNMFVPIRQAMDEFVYNLITSPAVDAGADGCTKLFMKVSVSRGEIANVCNIFGAAASGVDVTDFSTFVNGLIDPKTGKFRKNPSSYVPEGFADLLLASHLATQLFVDVLGAPEAGTYLADEQADGKMRLTALPEGGSTEDQLRTLAEDREIDDVEEFVQKNLDRVTEIPLGRVGKILESRSRDDGFVSKLDSLGYFWDKYAAMIALGMRDLGVRKYHEISMAGTAYNWPQTVKVTTRIFDRFITENSDVAAVPVTLKNGQAMTLPVEASMNEDLRAVSTIIALLDFATDQDFSMIDKLTALECTTGSNCSVPGDNEKARFETANGTRTFVAVQSDEKDSIMFSLVTKGQKIASEHNKALLDIRKAPKKQAEMQQRLRNFEPQRRKLEALIAKVPEAAELTGLLIDASEDSMSALKVAAEMTKGIREMSRPQAVNHAGIILSQLSKAEKLLTKLADESKGGKEEAEVPADLATLQKAFVELRDLLKETVNGNIDLAFAEVNAKSLKRDLEGVESKIRAINKLMNELNVR